MIVSMVVFAVFGLKLHFEENILKLLPESKNATATDVAFGQIKVKDKMFIQVKAADGRTASFEEMTAVTDAIVEGITEKDQETHYVDNFFYKVEDDYAENLFMGLVMGGENGAPVIGALTPEIAYPVIDSLMNEDVIDDMVSKASPALLAGRTGGLTLINNHFFCADSTVAIIFIEPAFNYVDSKSGSKMMRMVEKVVKRVDEAHPDVDVIYHGAVALSADNSRRIKMDLALTIGISLLIILLVLILCFKRFSIVWQLLTALAYGTFFAMACVYWIKGSMSLIAMGIGAVILGAAVSYCLHVITHHKFVVDVEQVLKEQSTPVVLGCLTTIGAFAALLFTSSELLRDFGMFASFALIGTTFFALTFMPHMLSNRNAVKSKRAFKIINAINEYPLDRNKAVVIALAVVTVVTCYFSRGVGFDNDLKNIGYVSAEVRGSEKLYRNKVNSGHKLQYYGYFSENFDEAVVGARELYHTLDSLKKEGMIFSCTTVANLIPTAEEQEENMARWKEYWTPERVAKDTKLIADACEKYDFHPEIGEVSELFESIVTADCDPIPDFFGFCTPSAYEPGATCQSEVPDVIPVGLFSNYVEKCEDGYLVYVSTLQDDDKVIAVDDMVVDIPNVVILDPFYYTMDLVDITRADFDLVLLFSSIFVFLVLLLSFRSLTVAIIGFLPMGLSWYIMQGMMALVGIEFNIINIMISTFIFGIGVDYSIFVMDGLINSAHASDNRLLVCHKAAILFSAFVLLVVTSSLLFAQHPSVHSIGICTIIGMMSTVLITYAIQPLSFRLCIKNKFLRRRMIKEK